MSLGVIVSCDYFLNQFDNLVLKLVRAMKVKIAKKNKSLYVSHSLKIKEVKNEQNNY